MTADGNRGIFVSFPNIRMITVAISDPNITYSQGLKTILEQMDGIEVVTVNPGFWYSEPASPLTVDILFIDEELHQEFGSPGGKKDKLFPRACTVILTLDSEIQLHCPEHSIPKRSGKKDFEVMVRKIALGISEQALPPT